jgi:hypothetical protein
MNILWQVKAPHFCAGMITDKTHCVHAAPILAWAIGKHRDFLRAYFARKQWQITFVSQHGAPAQSAPGGER